MITFLAQVGTALFIVGLPVFCIYLMVMGEKWDKGRTSIHWYENR